MSNEKHDNISRWPLIGLFGMMALVLTTGGYCFYRQDARAIQTDKLNDLKAVAELKCNQIVTWRNDRLADARVIASGIIQLRVLQWFKTADDAVLKAAILDRLGLFRQYENYQNIILAAPDGRLLLSADSKLTQLEPEAKALVARVVSSRQPVFGDLFRCRAGNQVYLDVAAPILDEAHRPLAVIMLRTDPEKLLYPLIQSWPLPSRSAETLLLRRDGKDALFLNVLRHRPDPALTLRIPLSSTDIPVVQAALGKTGEFEGRDYRNILVLAEILPVPGSSWSMVAKEDADEVLAEARTRGRIILLLVAMGVLMSGGLATLMLNYRRKNLYKALLCAEWEWRKAQEEIRATLYGIGDGVIATNAAGQVTRQNPVAASLTGWTEEEALGRPIHEVFQIVNEETRAEVQNPVDLVLREGRIVGLANHTLLIARDGIERPIADSAAPIQNEEGAPIGVVLVFRDQSLERAAQNELRKSKQQLDLALRSARMGVWYWDIVENRRYFDGQVCQMLGIDPAAFTGDAEEFFRIVHPDDREILKSALARTIEQDVLYEVEYRAIWADGSIHHIAARGLPVLDDAGRPLRLNGIIWDITERKRSEENILTMADMLDTAPNSILVHDFKGRILYANSKAFEMHGYGKDEFMSFSLHELDVPDSEKLIAERIQIIAEQGEARFEVAHFRKDGTILPLEIFAKKASWAGMPVMLSMGTDITERKRAEEEKEKLSVQLAQAQKMESVGRLAGGVAHDFNNMLAVIIGHTEMALDQAEPAEPMHKNLEEIQQAALHSADLTRQLLAFARKQAIIPRVLDLNETMSSMLKMLRRLIGENIELAWKPGLDLWPVKVDPSQVDQIIANLAVNARDAIAGVGHLTIQTENVIFDESDCRTHGGFAPGDYVLLAVSDTGAGMDKETLEHVFEPFFTTKEVGKGTGLGLAMVYGAVKQNHGSINVYSEQGQGTTFKIYLPRAKAVAAMTAPEKPAHGTETVLLTEDEESILNLGKAILKKHGYTVLTACTPAEALALAERHESPIHLLITDVVMPEMNGKELKDRIKILRPEIKVLFMSGYTSDIIAHQGVIDQDVEFLQKPFSVNALAQKVREVLDA